uniref:Uncharacterized protein n=1 Tax=Tetranychus urticae TaxID=32264 RepID=T1JR83_TETUR
MLFATTQKMDKKSFQSTNVSQLGKLTLP